MAPTPRGRGRRALPRPDQDPQRQPRGRLRAGGAGGRRVRRRRAWPRSASRGRSTSRRPGGPASSRGSRAPTRSRDALLVHGHLDVVPAMAEHWKVDPFSGEIADGCVWGRGAVDMKDMDAMILSVVRDRMRTGRRPEPRHRARLPRRRGGRRPLRRALARRPPPGPVRRVHRGDRRGRRLLAHRRPTTFGSTSSRRPRRASPG